MDHGCGCGGKNQREPGLSGNVFADEEKLDKSGSKIKGDKQIKDSNWDKAGK